MGYSKEQLLQRLQELQIDFAHYDHPVVLTVEAQAKYVGHLGGGLSKNLFLKDKKHRFYIVSALAGTTVDLKVLSQRLGLGKGGLRMAPEESLQEILQVPLGCVTPFALINDSARHVSLLLDQGFKAQEFCFFHPLSNDVTISVNSRDLDKFLISIGKEPSYVDLEANPPVGKDQPPDLAALVLAGTIVLPDLSEKAGSVQHPTENTVPVANNLAAVTGKAAKKSNPTSVTKDKQQAAADPLNANGNVRKFVEEIIDKTSALLLAEITKDSIQQHGDQLGTVISDSIRKRLSLDVESLAMMFKNTVYTQGYIAGSQTGFVRK
ncbi:PREDICTED: prolyl-tRNA synthetase associated domain-containing protein 1 [Nelumbo nucifera]|uniref:Prolyl-tRNA synthetase associated domain-containing protein 1 n=1 Tax=Nelumbo nucifera TaxID=4432 RepID=A0A1U8B8Z9_NELNU|nr:PREDICTED: prolyl-tRNA synthetase associated domain-containing protein 1 [Nelumbo nucifera]